MSSIQIEIIPESIKLLKISDEEYFNNPEWKDYISNSKLSLINPDEGGSIEKFKSGFKSDYSESFDLGSAVHSVLLQKEYYEVNQIVKPSAKLGLFCDELYKLEISGKDRDESISSASKKANYYSGKFTDKIKEKALEAYIPYFEARKEFEKNNISEKEQIYLSKTIRDKYERCINELNSNRQLMKLIYPESLFDEVEVYNEYALFADIKVIFPDREVILKFKGKLDNFTINHETKELTLNDLKTTGKNVNYFMGNQFITVDEEGVESEMIYYGSFQKYHYYRQLAAYLIILSAYMKTKGISYTNKANMLVVETIPNFKSKVYQVKSKQINKGLEEFKKLLILVAENE